MTEYPPPSSRHVVACAPSAVPAPSPPIRRLGRQVSAAPAIAATTVPPAAPTTAAPTTLRRRRPADTPCATRCTGLPIDGDARSRYTPRPALVVKIDNVDAEPQSGLNQADIVFEEIVEGRATRFAAVFNSMDSDPVGPIRSGRTPGRQPVRQPERSDLRLVRVATPGVTTALQATGWTLLDQGATGMFRDNTLPRRAAQPVRQHQRALARSAGDAGNAVPIFEYTAPGTESRHAGVDRSTSSSGPAVGQLGVRRRPGPVPALAAAATPTRPRPARSARTTWSCCSPGPTAPPTFGSPEAADRRRRRGRRVRERPQDRGHVEPDRRRPTRSR